jgi:hypothetical protein
MNKELPGLLVITAMIAFIAYPYLATPTQAESLACALPQNILLDQAKGKTEVPDYKPVLFNHAKHRGIPCVRCHHKIWESQKIQRCSASGCHDIIGVKSVNIDKERSLINAFHDTDSFISCIGCHSRDGKGPITCSGCHTSESTS